ncbi:MAG: hypothetical protein MZV70_40465 [Desulfobacterales bacterium]|nr:hypothetical protein [Desulfobacterales bacterium]
MQFEIQIQEGLKLTTRFDALERAWGQTAAVLTQHDQPAHGQLHLHPPASRTSALSAPT